MGTEGLSASRCWALMNPLLQPEWHGLVVLNRLPTHARIPMPTYKPRCHKKAAKSAACLPASSMATSCPGMLVLSSFGIVLNTWHVNNKYCYYCGYGGAADLWLLMWGWRPACSSIQWARSPLTSTSHPSPFIRMLWAGALFFPLGSPPLTPPSCNWYLCFYLNESVQFLCND